MKVLIVQETDWVKRYPVHQHHLAEMLSLRGHEIRVIDYEILWRTQGRRELCSRREILGNITKVHRDARVTIIRPGIVKIPWLDYVSLIFSHKREIERQMREFAPDVIIGFSILNSYLAAKATKETNIPFIYYWGDVLHELIPFKPFQFIGRMVESRTLKQADRVVVISDRLRDCVIRMGAPPQRTSVLRTGVNTEQFSPNGDSDTVRKRYSLGKQDIVLFFMGVLYNFSGLKEVALQLAKMKNHNLKLLVVGEGDIYDELQKMREEYNLQDRVILAGKKPYEEIPAFIAASDVCLLPAYPEEKIMQDIVPIKMYEYMAVGKPVIATKLPGVMREFGGGNGVVYVDNPEDVVAKAIELVSKGELKELGAKARSFVESYSWDSITDKFEGILEEAIREKCIGATKARSA